MPKDSPVDETTSASLRRSPRTRKQVAGLAVLALVVAGGLFYVGTDWYKGWQAERTVTSYLEAIQKGDVDEALSYTGTMLDEWRTDFLIPDALDTNWEVEDVSVQERDTSFSGDDYFRVEVTIGMESGAEVSNTLRVANYDDSGWTVGSSFAYLAFDSRNYGYLEINGHTADATTDGPRTVPRDFLLFPGVYDFYSEKDPLLEYDGDPVLIFGSESMSADGQDLGDGVMSAQLGISDHLALSDDAQGLYHQAIQDHTDECVEALTGDDHDGTLYGCELGAVEDQIHAEVGGSYSEFSGYQWEITSYPTAELEYEPEPDGEMIWLRGVSKQSGEATLTVEAADGNGSETQFEFVCEVSIEHSKAVLDETGHIYFKPKRFTGPTVFRIIYEDRWEEFFADTSPCSLVE